MEAGSGDAIISFSTLELQGNDQIVVYDGASSSATTLGVFVDGSAARTITGSTNTLVVLFTADYSGSGAVFVATMSSSECLREGRGGRERVG